MTYRKQLTPTSCWQACVGNLLGLPLEEVPDISKLSTEALPSGYEQWFIDLQFFLKRHGFFYLEIVFKDGYIWFPQPTGPMCMLIGRTESGVRHMILGRCDDGGFLPVFDPLTGRHDEAALSSLKDGGIVAIAFLVPLNPAHLALKAPENVVSLQPEQPSGIIIP